MKISLENIRTALFDPAVFIEAMKYSGVSALGRKPKLDFDGYAIQGFPSFSTYLGALKNLPTKEELDHIDRFVSPSSVVFDVGANFGVFTMKMAQAAYRGQTFAFEPVPRTAKALRDNISRNDFSGISVVEAAVSDSVGAVRISDTNDPATNKITNSNEEGIMVGSETLDHFCSENEIASIDFLKIDVEGAELGVLKGARELLSARKIGAGMIEICPENFMEFDGDAGQIVSYLNELGYKVFKLDRASSDQIPLQVESIEAGDLFNAGFVVDQ